MAKQPAQPQRIDDNDLRSSLMSGVELGNIEDVAVQRTDDGKIFGMNAIERMILSIVLFITVSVLGIALLFITGTIAIR